MADPMIDERLQAVEDKQAAAVQQVEDTFGGMAQNADQYFDKQVQVTQDWADKQTELQNQQTALTLEQIEQQKEQAGKDYTKEQAGAWTDYQKQIAQHGVQAEQMAAAGMTGTGFSESSKVAAYTTYQNRVAAAKASFDQVVMNYNNSMKEARLQNSSALAEISFNALQKGLELALQGFQYKNQLVTEGLGMKLDVENMYHGQYMDVWNQINTEKAQAEQIRQFEIQQENWQAEFDYGKEQDKQAQENWQAEFDAAMAQDQRDYEYRVGRDAVADSQWQQTFDYGKEQDAQAQRNWQAQFDYGKEQDKQAQANWQAEFDRDNAALAKQDALDRAQVLAASGDFSGYKAALGLTDAQVQKLESKYQSEIQTEADARAYEQALDKAKVLAAGGDFSGYKELYDLTDEQVKNLEEAYITQNAGGQALITDNGSTVPTGAPTTEPAGGNGITQEEANTRLNGIYGDLESYDFDNGSLAKLGYGDVSDEELMELYINGALDYTIVGGKMVFRKGKYYKDPRATKGGSTPPVGKNDPTVRQ